MDNKLTLIYIIVFSAILILLRTLGLASFNDYEILGYILIIYGLSLFYSSFISSRKLLLFLGSSLFLAGVIFLLSGSFNLQNGGQIIIPASLFVFAISSMMLFLFDKSSGTAIYSAVILFAGGVGAMALFSPYGLNNFIYNIIIFSEVFWPVIIILAAVVILFNRETRK
jgi:hypothetical protein